MPRVVVTGVILILSLISVQIPFVQGELSRNVLTKEENISILEDRKYFEVLLNRINEAGKDIVISMYVFKTTERSTNPANMIKDALIRAAHRGVEVKILLELEAEGGSSINPENEHTANMLRKGGVTVYFDSRLKRTHVKAVVIDRRYTLIGSHNLTASALEHNRELSLMIESKEVAMEAARYIEEMMRKTIGR